MSNKQGNQSLDQEAGNLASDAAGQDGSEGSSTLDKASLSQTKGVTDTGSIKVTR